MGTSLVAQTAGHALVAEVAQEAVARRILSAVYYILLRHEAYRAPGASPHDKERTEQVLNRMLRQIAKLGYTVSIEPTIAGAT
jgi:hypothetical protein